MEFKHEANVTWRNQWDKVNGAPNTLFVNYGTNLAEKHSVGVNYVHETIGFSRIHRAKVNYNYQFKLNETNKLVVGGAFSYQRLDFIPDWISPTNVYDPAIPTNATIFTGDLGIAYYSKNMMARIGVTQLPTSRNTYGYTAATHFFGNLR